MWMINTIETPDKIVVTGRGNFIVFFAVLIPTVFIMDSAINNPNWLNIVLSLILGFVSFVFFCEPSKTVSEFNLHEREILVKHIHIILKFSVKKIKFEDIESLEIISHKTLSKVSATGIPRSSMTSYSLTVNVKDQAYGVGTDLGYIPRAAELQEKLNQIIGLPK